MNKYLEKIAEMDKESSIPRTLVTIAGSLAGGYAGLKALEGPVADRVIPYAVEHWSDDTMRKVTRISPYAFSIGGGLAGSSLSGKVYDRVKRKLDEYRSSDTE